MGTMASSPLWSQTQASESQPRELLENRPVAVSISQVTVSFRSYEQRPTSFKESLLQLLKRGSLHSGGMFNALSNLSLTIERGSVLGIIGSNGSGKSTLLKVITQVLPPTRGIVDVKGSVGSLIELGVGFDPELNAIENIYLNGSLHRLSRAQIKERVDSILEFAELTDCAHKPIKYYSAGMSARLGFSVAVDINPDILIVDEVLGVGDERFQNKCEAVFNRFFESGKTIVMVSHNLEMLERRAHQIALLSRGELVFLGDPSIAVALYRDDNYKTALG